jgi:flagellar basal-body rod protein FlgB
MSVSPIYVFDLAAQHASWATVRQAVITGNIANANTAGYAAQDVTPFSAVMDQTASVALATTNPGHLSVGAAGQGDNARTWDVEDTGARVTLDGELMKADETNRAFALDMSIVKAFHRMLMMSARGGA